MIGAEATKISVVRTPASVKRLYGAESKLVRGNVVLLVVLSGACREITDRLVMLDEGRSVLLAVPRVAFRDVADRLLILEEGQLVLLGVSMGLQRTCKG